MRRGLGVLLVACTTAAGVQPLRFTRHDVVHLGAESMRGFAISGGRLAAWGERLRWWSIPEGRTVALGPRGPFGEGGAILDADGDGLLDIVVNEGPPQHALVWFHAPRWTRHVIDTGVDTVDVMSVEL